MRQIPPLVLLLSSAVCSIRFAQGQPPPSVSEFASRWKAFLSYPKFQLGRDQNSSHQFQDYDAMLLEFPGSSSTPWGGEFPRRAEPPLAVAVDWRRPPTTHPPHPPLYYYPGTLYSPASAPPGRFWTAVPTNASPPPPPAHYLSAVMPPQNGVAKFQPPLPPPAWNSLYTMPAPTYRLPVTTKSSSTLSSDPGLDAQQRAQLARIAEENEPSGVGGRSTGENEAPKVDKTMERIWENIATSLPKLAETVAELGGQLTTTTLPTQPGVRKGSGGEDTAMGVPAPAGLKGLVPSGDEKNSKSATSIDETRGVASLINSMPDPNSLFTYSRLFKSTSRSGRTTDDGGGDGQGNYGAIEPQRKSRELTTIVGVGAAKKSESVAGEEMEGEVKGRPIFKSGEDGVTATPRSSASPITTSPQPTTGTPGMQSQSLVMNWLQPFLGSMRLPESSNNHKVASPETHYSTSAPPVSTTYGDNPAENLLGSIMSGRLNQIDWVNSLLGTHVAAPTQGAAQEGNALAQLFGGGRSGKSSFGGSPFGLGTLLGSGLDDDATIVDRGRDVDGRAKGR